MALDDIYPAVPDQAETIDLITSLGNQVDLFPNQKIVMLADALLAVERGRLRETKKKVRKKLEDFAGNELDDFWGTLLNIQRLPGNESAENFVGDPDYIHRIQKMFAAYSLGISEEAVRLGAEAGSGVPFRITKSGPRLVLTPLEDINAAQKMGALEVAKRIAPASALVEMGPTEDTHPTLPVEFYSPDFYIGENPLGDGLTGPKYDGPNAVLGATADKWDIAPEGSLGPGSGEPSQISRAGVWHTPILAFGKSATLKLSVDSGKVTSRATLMVSDGTWLVHIADAKSTIHEERYIMHGWGILDLELPTDKRSELTFTFTNLSQKESDLFAKSAYVGLRLTDANREKWLQLGGLEGTGGNEDIVSLPAEGVKDVGGKWISKAYPTPDAQVEFYIELSGVPVKVSSLSFKTDTPGAIFRVEYSSQNEPIRQVTEWTAMPGVYTLRQGRVKIRTTIARHLKLVFSNLRPMLLRRYENGVM